MSRCVGFDVFQLAVAGFDQQGPHESLSLIDFQRHRQDRGRAMYYTKTDVANVELTARLQQVGFQLVDTSIMLVREPTVPVTMPLANRGIQVRKPTSAEFDEVLEIAASCFRYSRFHADPQMPDHVAHHIKREWTANCLRGGRGDLVLVSVVDGRVTGFLSALTVNEPYRCGVIDLIGVDTSAQRTGTGSALVQAFNMQYSNRCQELKVGTQLANTGSLRLYQKFGFTIGAASHVLHFHQ